MRPREASVCPVSPVVRAKHRGYPFSLVKIAIATCSVLPEIDPDEDLTRAAFVDRGHDVDWVPWDGPTVSFSDYDAVIIRSTWNYPYDPERFSEWVHTVSAQTRLLNPAEVVLGNIHKSYLLNLASKGVPIVPTRIFSAGEFTGALLSERSVIKPAIGAASWDARSFTESEGDEAADWLATMPATREFLIQPYFDSVHTVGEQSIMIIGGEPTHQVTKRPRFEGQHESVEGPLEVCREFAELAAQCLEPYGDELLYARLDLMQSPAGEWCVSELELIEPSLFFTQFPPAATRMAEAAERLLA